MGNELKIERIEIDGEKIDIAIFSMPMYHESWHKVEELGLELAHISSEGGDYWDSSLYFTKPENVEKVRYHLDC